MILILIFFSGCKEAVYENIASTGREPVIEPDYSGVTIPKNIAPMNFIILEEGTSFLVRAVSLAGTSFIIKSSDGTVQFPLKLWKKLLAESQEGNIEIDIISVDKEKKLQKYDPVIMRVANEPLDPYLCYRLLYPGYESWVEMKIVQRSTEDFRETSIFENQLLKDNCVNCHSFKQNQSDRFLLHVRGSLGGTYFIDGEKITRTALRTENMPANAVYPSWHPSGKYVAFSSNKTVQSFHMHTDKNIEVSDMYSSMFLYDVERNGMSGLPQDDSVKYMETFPCWSPEGNYLYYCRTIQVKDGYDFKGVKYDLVRRSFDSALSLFGNAEVVFNASEKDKSVSFPSVSPDGQFLVFTLHDYGTFSIWHKEADLYLLNLKTMKTDKMNLNSNETESWHSWSSNGKWIVFSSKRGDGLTARPYFAYFGTEDSVGKPFVLPQKDPSLYQRLGKTFNRPELVTGKIKTGPIDFMKASKQDPLKAKWIGN
ncbi:MAG: hypothetical protein A2X05_11580 [Bacteroidetes bacterium GWE2_41_25]|nr:MAG: hypothetical protein A2X03_00020 [Bacteroidetes bacterium GWA2_40_15]OFX96167.1 MAG: hypothetical protein A2X05_11580 [Bacteroidetes bacterium GWE2_41_25]OFY01570.1 MAG: hypothetical protein A2X06_03640 [Bacteroidetes bacterium GWC2_40_22]OFY60616.1 MAG: hypothetical protein A2X04_08615 [Bacteroidetes bacterium GWF2_41_9]